MSQHRKGPDTFEELDEASGEHRIMERVNRTSSVSDFNLLGLSSNLSTRSHSLPRSSSESHLLAAMATDHYAATCDPFHDGITMSLCCRVPLLSFSSSISHLHLLLVLLISCLLFYGSSGIHHFLCDINPLLKLSCFSTSVDEIVINTEGLMTLVTLFVCIIISYLRILVAVPQIPSPAEKHNASLPEAPTSP
ncbi:Olfactory Receptor 1L3 [Manis pentadactyla]|nr:Olfactory Receptor 1L3 [Manis pentadactyla]